MYVFSIGQEKQSVDKVFKIYFFDQVEVEKWIKSSKKSS